MLSFQRLDVYQRAIEFLALVGDLVDELPKGHSARADQLVRAAESVVRKIAEGAGRWSEADSAKHYKIARGEAMECRIARRDEAAEAGLRRAVRRWHSTSRRCRCDVDEDALILSGVKGSNVPVHVAVKVRVKVKVKVMPAAR